MEAALSELLTPENLAESIDAAWKQFIIQEESRTPSKRPYTYASSYEECERKLVLLMTDGDKVTQFEAETLAKFRRGNDRARDLGIDLARVGQLCRPPFKVVKQEERFELKDGKGRIVIAGKVDCRLEFSRDRQLPVEIKAWSENLTAKLSTFADCFRNPWTKKGAFQLLCYLFGSGEPYGFLLLAKSGLPCLLPVNLYDHLEEVETFLKRAESALDHKETGTLPDFITDTAECKRCAFYGGVCDPPTKGEGAQIFTDPEEEARLARMIELEPLGEEYDALEKWAKERFRGVEIGIAGSVLIQGEWQRNTTYPVPESVKKQIEILKSPYKSVVDKGKWFMTVTKT